MGGGGETIVVIGAGINSLTAAFYLARAGFKPVVLEARPRVGGCAITEEFHSGFRCSTLAHTCELLHPTILRDMQLNRLGLQLLTPDTQVLVPSLEGPALLLYRDPARSVDCLNRLSPKDAESYREFQRALHRVSKALDRLLCMTPPALEHPTIEDLWRLLQPLRTVRRLGKKEMFRLLRWGAMPVADLVGELFESERLRALTAGRALFGVFQGPRSPGTGLLLLLRSALGSQSAGTICFPRQGMGALAEAMAEAARRAGAVIRTQAEVARISVQNDRVTGVILTTGEECAAKAVISGTDPQRTFLRLLDSHPLSPDFLMKIQNYRCKGSLAKVNLALARLPTLGPWVTTASDDQVLAGRIQIGPEVDYLERAFDEAKYGGFSSRPWLDITIPSVLDSSLAPPGRHVMSIWVHYAPYDLCTGSWESQREALADQVIHTLASYAPELPDLVVTRQILTPLDLETSYMLTGGHIFHGELALDQFFSLRPVLGWADYRTPIRGLYLCGSGTHPGTGLSGISGANAAREVCKDFRGGGWVKGWKN